LDPFEVSLGEFVTGSGFQVSLKSASQFNGSEFDADVDDPWFPRRRGHKLTGVMKPESRRHISSDSDVSPTGAVDTAKDVDEAFVQAIGTAATLWPDPGCEILSQECKPETRPAKNLNGLLGIG
jgi:hypothetical protein